MKLDVHSYTRTIVNPTAFFVEAAKSVEDKKIYIEISAAICMTLTIKEAKALYESLGKVLGVKE